jgi:predicted RNase H-like HicB family nuclease
VVAVSEERKTYEVTAERDGERWWFLRVPELGTATQARRLDHAEAQARDLIATWLDVAPDSFEVAIRPQLDDETRALVVKAAEAKARVQASQHFANAAQQAAAQRMAKAGLTMRDAGAILGLTHQRIQQILSRPELDAAELANALYPVGSQVDIYTAESARERITTRG